MESTAVLVESTADIVFETTVFGWSCIGKTDDDPIICMESEAPGMLLIIV